MMLPVVVELSPPPDAADAFRRLCDLPHCLFLDSALRDPELGRYSFLAVDPYEFLTPASESADGKRPVDAFAAIAAKLHEPASSQWPGDTIPDLPPFQGGLAGYIGYEAARGIEQIPRARYDEFQAPMVALGWYDTVLAFDHRQGRAWIISHGLPERDDDRRLKRAHERVAQWKDWLSRPPQRPPTLDGSVLAASDLAARYPVSQNIAGRSGLMSSFSEEDYLAAVGQAIEYIHAGDIFQVNLAQRLLVPAADDAVSLYLRLRERNPAPFAAYFDTGPFQIASASPERFLRCIGGAVETRPIKGTRRRTARPEADLYAGDELRGSEKDLAENVMIVDLLRNDLSRVCLPDSVIVSDLCKLERYEFVQHLVSVVRGQLQLGRTPLDLLRAAFPGGSITGAPKIRAMEIIAELEPVARGPYCGALGYIGFDGSMDTNIPIRTITAGRGWWQFPVGGGIVAASSPRQEYQETWHKAQGLLRSLQ